MRMSCLSTSVCVCLSFSFTPRFLSIYLSLFLSLSVVLMLYPSIHRFSPHIFEIFLFSCAFSFHFSFPLLTVWKSTAHRDGVLGGSRASNSQDTRWSEVVEERSSVACIYHEQKPFVPKERRLTKVLGVWRNWEYDKWQYGNNLGKQRLSRR